MRKLAIISVLLTAVLMSGCSKTQEVQPTDADVVPTETVTDSMTNSGDTTAPAEAEETTEAQTAGTTETTGTTGTAETTVTAEADADVQPTDAEPVERSVREIYREALDNLHDHNMLPDGDEADTTLGDIEENQFAIFDVDGDGRDELIIRIAASAPMAGMVEMVYDLNEQGALGPELPAVPSLPY